MSSNPDDGDQPDSSSFVEEDTPSLRSVPVHATRLLQQPSPFDGSSLAKTALPPLKTSGFPPPLGLKKPPPAAATQPQHTAQPQQHTSWGLKEEWSATTTTPCWIVRADELEPVPADFFLERTHREIYADPTVVSERISRALRILSIASSYGQTPPVVSCQTDDCVQFKIRLFAGSSESSGQPILVEVQRESGPAFCFVRTCRALLDAAEGTTTSVPPGRCGPPPLSKLQCLQDVVETKPPQGHCLETARRLLASRRDDERILALQDLCALTDPTKSAPRVALNVSKTILTDESLRHTVGLMLLPTQQPNTPTARAEVRCRYLALVLLGNACSLCHTQGCLGELLVEHDDEWFVQTLTPRLLGVLARAKDQTTCAYRAAQCLSGLMVCHPRILAAVAAKQEVLETAHACGGHTLLETETQRCLEAVRGYQPQSGGG